MDRYRRASIVSFITMIATMALVLATSGIYLVVLAFTSLMASAVFIGLCTRSNMERVKSIVTKNAGYIREEGGRWLEKDVVDGIMTGLGKDVAKLLSGARIVSRVAMGFSVAITTGWLAPMLAQDETISPVILVGTIITAGIVFAVITRYWVSLAMLFLAYHVTKRSTSAMRRARDRE